MDINSFIEQSRPHESGSKHVSGYANYIDDIIEPEGTLYGAIGYSKKSHAIISKLDLRIESLTAQHVEIIAIKDQEIERLTAATLKDPRSLFITSVANASPSISSAITSIVLPA